MVHQTATTARHKDSPLSNLISKYREVWGDDPCKLLDEYDYQPELTRKLDALQPEELDIRTFYEMVLWKLNRFPSIPPELLEELKEVGRLAPGQQREAQPVLHKLLRSPGIALPMASTILRFLNPSTFQIIDDRVYRIVHPGKAKYPNKPQRLTQGYLDTSSGIYFDYLDELRRIASEQLPFELADRILYQLDIRLGNRIGDTG